MNLQILSVLLLICGAMAQEPYRKMSVQSHIFEPLRPKGPPKNITAECDAVVTEPYGQLQKTYQRGELADGSSCSWLLRAPANHVINVISLGFQLQNKTKPQDLNDYSGSEIFLREKPDRQKILMRINANLNQHSNGVFAHSTTVNEELEVQTVYHDSLSYATQTLFIQYEFLNADEVQRLRKQFLGH